MKQYIATIGKTKYLVDKYDFKLRKSFGQNFIIDYKTVEKIASLCSIDKETTVLEIGSGIGSLTEQMAILGKKVISFEIDQRLIPILQESLEDYDNVEIINQDFLKVDLNDYQDLGRTVVTGNLPYYVTTPILFHIFESDKNFSQLTLMMQKEVAQRLSAKPNTKEYNALSVIVQYMYDVKIVMKVGVNVFIPKPKVDSSVVSFIRREQDIRVSNLDLFKDIVKASFTQRRKTLNNNLKSILTAEQIKLVFEKLGYPDDIRAESLIVDDFINIYEIVQQLHANI